MFTEDLDLCHKVKQSGRRNYYIPGATIIHFGGSSSNQAVSHLSSVMIRESVWHFLRKTRGNLYGFGYRCSMMISALCRLGVLGILFPVYVLRCRRASWLASFGKWQAILWWSLGGENEKPPSVKGAQQSEPTGELRGTARLI